MNNNGCNGCKHFGKQVIISKIMDLQSWRKYLEQSKKNKHTGSEQKFDDCFCVIFSRYY